MHKKFACRVAFGKVYENVYFFMSYLYYAFVWRKNSMFDSFVSLGWFCGTASAMSRYGLRKMSSPFDWCFSELYGVIHFLESDFNDFMSKDNIKVLEERPGEIKDVKWEIHFTHDIKEDYEKERDTIVEKYSRRIENLKEEIKRGSVCFVRAVHSQDEIKYIVNNAEYIQMVIKKYNECNEIIFLIPYYMVVPTVFPFKKYILKINIYQGNCRTALRDMFDTNQDFIEYCQNNYAPDKLAYNKVFDLEKECRFWRNRAGFTVEKNAVKKIDNAYKNIQINESRFQRLLMIARCDFSKLDIPNKIIIYGAGDIGKFFYDKIYEYTQVLCFLDKAPFEEQYKSIPIIKPNEYIPQNDITVIVIPTYDFKEIKEFLQTIWNIKISIIGIEEFLI